ncbi:MAG TPA: ABC transporter ATP-binding protein [Aggregatilineales bacterium]|nr:ABC transporter ATP-binding protein [Aggregatilineales bacterium]
MSASPVLRIDSLDVFYGQFQALFGVHVEVMPGETIAIIGANGAGKTTLLNTIAGVLKPAAGKIFYNGQDITGKPAYKLNQSGIAMVPEGRKIFPSLSAEENLTIGAYSQRKGMWTLPGIYELFPMLQELAHLGGTDLSGGQQQMVAIGRALMSNPDLILMDEISLGLAPIIVNELYEVVHKITQSGTTVILVEQDVTRGMKEALRVYCLLEGRVSLEGATESITREQITRAYFGV